jgi:hypothetical protein
MILKIIRLIFLILSIIVTILLFVYHMVSYYKFMKKRKYQYIKIHGEKYLVVKEGFSKDDCTHNSTSIVMVKSTGLSFVVKNIFYF